MPVMGALIKNVRQTIDKPTIVRQFINKFNAAWQQAEHENKT
jgi:hypothetical protein